ncbi:MAG TPA: hypothetical protein PKA64_15755, partial [Myxococcota bacterium]|nr:hypothetical protein [Myxococcota bacterium]
MVMRLGAAGCAMILAGPALASEVRWRGSVDLGASELGLILVVGDAGATLSIPAQGLTDGPLHDVVIADDALSFTLGLDAMPEAAWARFTLAVDASAGSASGTMLQFGRSFPVTLRRLADGEPAAAR